jgi:alpha-beta hydrolase superfamily lysophospholipase
VSGAISVLTAPDGYKLPYRYFAAPPGRRRASAVYLHGIQSHGGWYVETASELASRGFDMYLPDRRGSGASSGTRGYFDNRRQLVDDARCFLALSRRTAPDVPTFLIGGCWGARTAVSVALHRDVRLAGLVLVAPAIKAKVDLRLADKLRVVLGTMVRPKTRVPVPLTPEMFTRNPPYLDFIRTDPLTLRKATARFFFETFLWERELRRENRLSLPLLLLRPADDPIVDGDAVQEWFDRQASPDKQTVVYPDAAHILDFEEDRRRYWDDLAGWLADRSAPAPTVPSQSREEIRP